MRSHSGMRCCEQHWAHRVPPAILAAPANSAGIVPSGMLVITDSVAPRFSRTRLGALAAPSPPFRISPLLTQSLLLI